MALALQMVGLSRQYRARTRIMALDSVSLDVERAALLAVIGREGSGKSTLLRILAGVERPTGGRFSHPDIDARHVGTMLQGDVLSIRHTLAENVAAPLKRLRPAPRMPRGGKPNDGACAGCASAHAAGAPFSAKHRRGDQAKGTAGAGARGGTAIAAA